MAYTTINKSTDYFNTKLYTGTGAGQSITGVGFQPDWSWIKVRNISDSHVLVDAVRGATKFLQSNNNSAETTSSSFVQAFTSDGLTLGGNQGTSSASNTYASWNWKANGAGSANTDGSISSTVSANTTAGFSIVSYTGTGSNATVGHGLGFSPKIVMIKRKDSARSWRVGGEAIGTTQQYLTLNETLAIDSANTGFQSFSTTTFGIGTDIDWNASGGTYIAYCFADKTGYSKFGSYSGNQNTDGTFVYTGFKPAFLMIKRYSTGNPTTTNWQMFDSKRLGYNVDNNQLQANLGNAEGTDDDLDILSNGFKLRGTGADLNNSGHDYIYMAFAEAPLVGSNNVPCTAR